jgi:hypothetical protein
MENNNFSSNNKALCSQFSNQQFIDYLLQQLSSPIVKEIDAHILQCQPCLDRLSHWSNMIKSRDSLVKQIQAKRPFFLGGSTGSGIITDTPAAKPAPTPPSLETVPELELAFWHLLQQLQPLPALFRLQLELDSQRCQRWSIPIFLKLWFNKLTPDSAEMYELDRHLISCASCQENLQRYFNTTNQILQTITIPTPISTPMSNSAASPSATAPIIPTVLLEIQLQDLEKQAKALKESLETSLNEEQTADSEAVQIKMQQIEQKLAAISFSVSSFSPAASPLTAGAESAAADNLARAKGQVAWKIAVLFLSIILSLLLSYWLHQAL